MPISLRLTSFLVLAMAGSAVHAQFGKGTPQSSTRARVEARAAEVAERLALARRQAEDERAKLDREASARAELAVKAEAAANDPEAGKLSSAQAVLADRGEVALQEAMKNVSSEGMALLVSGAEVTADRTRSPRELPGKQIAQGAPAADSVPTPTAPSAGSPQPQPLKPASLDSERSKQERVVILCDGAAFFDPKNSIGIFSDNVRVYHPSFYIEGDELEIHMKKDAELDMEGADKTDVGVEAVPLVTNLSVETPEEGGDGQSRESPVAASQQSSIDFVIVRGPMVLIEKQTENGEIQVGKCKKATYDADTEEVLMSGLPQVQRGAQLQIATDPNTTMTILPTGAFRSNGPSKTDILRGKDAKVQSKTLRLPPGE